MTPVCGSMHMAGDRIAALDGIEGTPPPPPSLVSICTDPLVHVLYCAREADVPLAVVIVLKGR